MRFNTLIKIAIALVLLMVAGVALFLKSMDFNEYKGVIAEQVKAATGRDLVINGDFDLKLSLSPALTVNDLTFANAAWGSRPEMVKLQRLEVVVNLLPLLSGDIRVKRLVLISPDILLETDPKGRGNWVFGEEVAAGAKSSEAGTKPKKDASIPLVNEVQIKNASLTYKDGPTQKSQHLSLETLTGRAADLQSPLELRIAGSYNNRIETTAKTGSVGQLTKTTAPFPVHIEAQFAGNMATVDGTIKIPLEGKGVDLNLSAKGKELAELVKLADLPQMKGKTVLSFGPFDIAAHVKDSDGKYALTEITVSVGTENLVLLNLKGTVQNALEGKGIDLNLSAKGKELAELLKLAEFPKMAGKEISPMGPFDIAARLSGSKESLSLKDLAASMGTKEVVLLHVKGAVQNALKGKGLNLHLVAEGVNLAKLPKVTDAEFPSVGPFRLAARITDPGGAYSIENLEAKLGRSEMTGTFSVKTGGNRPYLKADLTSLNLEPDEFIPPEGKPEAKVTQGNSGEKETKKERLFSDAPFPLDGLRAVDARIKVAKGRVLSNGVELGNLTLEMVLENSKLVILNLKGNLSDATLSANLSLDAQKPKAQLKTGIQIKDLDLPPLLKKMEATNLLSVGKADMEIDLSGSGESMRALMAGLDGKVSLAMGEGRIENKYMDFMAADLTKLITPGGINKEYTAVNCFVCRFDIKEGLATSKGLLLDTEQITVAGDGNINLADETLKLTMNPKPREKSLVSLAVPVHIRGTLTEPSVQPDTASVAKGVAGAILGTVAMGPAGLLVPLVNKGTGDQNPCLEALAKGTQTQPASTTKESASQPATSQEPAKKIEEGIKNIFKGLGGIFK